MSGTVYTVEVSYPLPSRRARLAAWVRRRRPARVAVVAFPPCPTCSAAVSSTTPLIRAGAEYSRGIANWKDPDKCIGHHLEPCGHRVDELLMVAA